MKTIRKKEKIIIVLSVLLLIIINIFNPIIKNTQSISYYKELTIDNEKLIALTFDDGPNNYTDKLLDGLKENDAKASFFIIGKKVKVHADIIKRMHDEGHLIGNHTYSHANLFKKSAVEFQKELDKTNDIIKEVVGTNTQFFRPPHGWYIKPQLKSIDGIAILWTNDPADWKHHDADYVYNYITKHAHDGAVFLLHDTQKTTVDGVLKAIKELKEDGYQFVRVDELLCRNGDRIYQNNAYYGCKKERKPF